MKLSHFKKSYKLAMKKLLREHEEPRAMSLAVGGDFEAVGLLEYYLLLQTGLRKEDVVVDVGCGSGRLAYQLRNYLSGLYVGIDVLPELHEYAREVCGRPDWKFYTAPGLSIPEPDGSADYVCFFSVFTHLLHEESFRYLEDAKRVLKAGGKIVLSFLEFQVHSHWAIFEGMLANSGDDRIHNQFVSRDAIQAWADHLGFEVVSILSGDEFNIDLKNTALTWDNGMEMAGRGRLGQSVCILTGK